MLGFLVSVRGKKLRFRGPGDGNGDESRGRLVSAAGGAFRPVAFRIKLATPTATKDLCGLFTGCGSGALDSVSIKQTVNVSRILIGTYAFVLVLQMQRAYWAPLEFPWAAVRHLTPKIVQRHLFSAAGIHRR